MSGKEKS